MKRLVRLIAFVALLVLLALGTALLRDRDRAVPARLQAKSDYLHALSSSARSHARLNVLVILYDDLGYGDFGIYGNRAYRTPAIDALGRNGLVFTQYYAPAPVCTPSRAATLTGRYALRTGLTSVVFVNHSPVDWWMKLNGQSTVMPHDEILLPEILRASGYRTAMVGKWHLGDIPGSRPTDFGFDHFFGALYSNDIQPFELYENNTVAVPAPVDQSQLNERYTDAVLRTINEKSDKPFFIYLAHNMPHLPLHASAKFLGKSGAGLYGDVIEELDDGVRRIADALQAQGQLDNTLILITSDNGPWYQGGAPGGRGRKGSTFEGGMRVPMIVHWPATVKPAVVATPVIGVDILPTVLDYVGIAMPTDRAFDGKSWRGVIEGRPADTTHPIFYFGADRLTAMRDGILKYQAQKYTDYLPEPGRIGFPMQVGPWLFDLERDPLESYDLLSSGHPSPPPIVARFDKAQKDFSANPRGWLQTPPQ